MVVCEPNAMLHISLTFLRSAVCSSELACIVRGEFGAFSESFSTISLHDWSFVMHADNIGRRLPKDGTMGSVIEL